MMKSSRLLPFFQKWRENEDLKLSDSLDFDRHSRCLNQQVLQGLTECSNI